MLTTLNGRDYRFIAICAALFLAATWYSANNFYRAFPEASIDFRVSRADAENVAQTFLKRQGDATAGYREASSFTYDDDAKTFLEREVGLERANGIMGKRVRLWRWSYRWFRPLQKEEFRASVTPAGRVVGFSHEIAEDAARPAVSADAARQTAEDFLRSRMGRDPASLEFVELAEQARPHRTDRTFTWKERDFDLHDATYRVEVAMLGGEVAGYREYLKIPEQWTRDYQKLRSKNDLAQTVDTAFLAALVVGLIVVIAMRVRRGDVRWRRAAVVGAIGMALSLCAHLNEFPLQEFGYPTTDSYSSFLSRQVLQALVESLAAGGLLFVLAAGAEPLYREAYGDKISLGNLFRPRGLRTKRFLLGAMLGITLTAVFLAYQTIFYLTAYRFGAWSPADVPYSDLLNTRFPWLFVLIGGYLPAVSEEFLFRMFAIPFLRKLLRWTPAAVVLAGFVWGFGHAGYPQQPFYIRGVEVGIGGVALGIVMLRWGILPTLVWHYSVDAMYSAMLLLRSHSWYFRLSGAASAGIVALPVAIALAAYWKRGGFAAETGLLNRDEAAPAPAEEPAPMEEAPASAARRPLPGRMRWAAAAIFAAGLLALLIPVEHFGAQPRYAIGRERAQAMADAFVRTLGTEPGAFRRVTFPTATPGEKEDFTWKYVLERRSLAAASELFARYRPVQRWTTRYFKSLDEEEIVVRVHPETGKILSFQHTVPEDRPGATIPDERARELAAGFAAAHGWDVSGMELKESASEKKKARLDHSLVWEAPPGDPRNVDEAHFRLFAEVAGDRVTAVQFGWKLPEAYTRERAQQNFISVAVVALDIAVTAGALVWTLFLLVQNVRRGLVRWGAVIRIAIPGALLAALALLLSRDRILANYNTAVPLETFQALIYVTVVLTAIFGFLLLGGAVALTTSAFPGTLDALRSASRRALGMDAAAALLAAVGLGLLLHQADALAAMRFHAQALISVEAPELLASAAPAVSAIADAFRGWLISAALLTIAALVSLRRPKLRVPLALLAIFALLPGDIHTPGEFALQYGLALAMVACIAVVSFGFARDNCLAYALVLWVWALRSPLGELLGIAIPAIRMQGWIVAAVLAATVIWAVGPALARRPEATAAASGSR
jgi:membrane protease YdiL (CAAX protease family)